VSRSPAVQALREEAEPQFCLALARMSTSEGIMDGIAPDNLTHANVMDGNIKYKTLRKNKLHLLCGNLLDHIKDLEVEKAKVELRHKEELKEAKVEKLKVELRLEEELELKEAVFFVDNNGTGATSNGEDDVKGVEEGDVNVNATSSEAKSVKLAKSAKLSKLVKLAKSTDLWCLSPRVLLEAKDKQKQRKVCQVELQGKSARPTTAGANTRRSALWPTTARGRSPRQRACCGTCGSRGETPPETPTGTAATTTPSRPRRTRTSTSPGSSWSTGPRSSRQGSGQQK
jgi:hypothetical protein